MRYRKRPVEVEAIVWTGENRGEVSEFMGGGFPVIDQHNNLLIYTLEGVMRASPGDYVIRGVRGELYPCKPDVFAETYEEDERC